VTVNFCLLLKTIVLSVMLHILAYLYSCKELFYESQRLDVIMYVGVFQSLVSYSVSFNFRK